MNLAATTTFHSPEQNRSLKAVGNGFFWLSAFYVVYCARPEDWVHFIRIIPLAKITGIGAFVAFLSSAGRGKRRFRDLPVESNYLLALLGVLMLSSVLSPVWKGGAIVRTIEFAKVYMVFALTFFLVTNLLQLRRIMFIQAASVPVVCILSIIKGHSAPRLEGVLGGIYSNPNDLAFAIVLSMPFCLMFLLTARGIRKLPWAVGMLAMAVALVLTASRGGFITLLVSGAVCLWHFGVKGRRFYLIGITALVGLILLGVAGGPLKTRFATMWNDEADTKQQSAALTSYEQRKYLVERALDGIKHYPILGMGTRNFETYSMNWQEVHMTYLEITVEGGFISLILYLLFFARGFRNLKGLLKRKDLSPEVRLISGALHSSLVGFVVGALFAPEAYEFFPFFTVAYTSALLSIVKQEDAEKAAAAAAVQATASDQLLRPVPAWNVPSPSLQRNQLTPTK